ncbi:MAG: aminoacyl-tRNA hydrolase [Arenicellaceae bacterium]|nr:aminoacyl-tRNA hydrolase [Arenicellaceae bacterium]
MPNSIKLIVGLGNPGAKYAETRHNAGFLFLDAVCRKSGLILAAERHANAESAPLEGGLIGNSSRCMLLAPQTFMNLSGDAVQSVMSYYKIGMDEVLVVHDELDLSPGIARLKQGGGHGGHNGLRDIINKCGEDFYRLRLGVGHPGRPELVNPYLTHQRIPRAEMDLLDRAIKDSLDQLSLILAGDLEPAMNSLHTES